MLDQAYRFAQEVEPKLPMYFYVLRDTEMIRKLVAVVRIYLAFTFLHADHPFADNRRTRTAKSSRIWLSEIHLTFRHASYADYTGAKCQCAVRQRRFFLWGPTGA